MVKKKRKIKTASQLEKNYKQLTKGKKVYPITEKDFDNALAKVFKQSDLK
jgi:hypothetical protein